MNQDKVVGIIGGGNMGSGIAGGIVKAGILPAAQVIMSDINQSTLNRLRETFGIRVTDDNTELCTEADIIFLVVKPYQLSAMIQEIRDFVNADALVVSVAAGQTLDTVAALFGRDLRLVRIMPNLGAVVGESMTGYVMNGLTTQEDHEDMCELLGSFGRFEELPEKLMDVVTAVSGSAPAYICTMIEAMADAAVLNGMPRASAYKVCEQAMLGTARYLLETGVSPAALKDMVCTPGGTSITAVAEMERLGIRNAIISGVTACTEKSKKIGT